MKKLLISGWRGISHSYSLVNQRQILALSRLGKYQIFHHDMPYIMANWNPLENAAGFGENDSQLLAGLPDLPPEQADICYRICSPIPSPTQLEVMTVTFIVTELGVTSSMFADASLPPSAYSKSRDLIVTPSRWARDRLVDYGFREQSVRVIGHGVDTKDFYPLSPQEREECRKNLGIDADVTVFLNVGAPIWIKGADLLIEAFARVHLQNPRTKLIFKSSKSLYGLSINKIVSEVGARHPGLITETLIAAISEVPANLSQDQLRQLYGVSDWYVSPYRAEGFNLPVLEAMACGKPVIITSGGSTDDFCNGEAVFRIPSTFCRRPFDHLEGACWLEPHLPSLIELMVDASSRGPDRHDLLSAALSQAKSSGWDGVALEMARLFEEADPNYSASTAPSAIFERPRSIHIYCDGGFGNRFNTLVSGMILAKLVDLQPIVVWPRNNWCGASFFELFDNDFNVIERELINYAPDKELFHFFMTEDHLNLGVENRSPLSIDSLDEALEYLKSDHRDVYYHSPLIPEFLYPDEVLKQVRQLKINAEIIANAEKFIIDQNLNDYFGVQVRKTDFGPNGADESHLYELISNADDKKFFVCSDDNEVEQRFSALPNVAVYVKRAHVEKLLEEGDWNSVTTDSSGRAYACNVNRSAISVIDAVIDLLILSHSMVVKTSNSTFLQTALVLKNSRNMKKYEEIDY